MRLPALVLGLALSLAACGAAAQTDLPPGVFAGGKSLADATAGTYAVDPAHAAVLVRVSHIGYSWSVFRFDEVAGKLVWDQATPTRSTLSVAVKTKSITSNVAGFAAELTGEQFLKSATYPEATFVSTSFRQTDATRGKVEGQFTLMGRTKPLTFDVELAGAGKGFFGKPRLGVQARGSFNPQDYGMLPLLGETMEIVVDVEFEREP